MQKNKRHQKDGQWKVVGKSDPKSTRVKKKTTNTNLVVYNREIRPFTNEGTEKDSVLIQHLTKHFQHDLDINLLGMCGNKDCTDSFFHSDLGFVNNGTGFLLFDSSENDSFIGFVLCWDVKCSVISRDDVQFEIGSIFIRPSYRKRHLGHCLIEMCREEATKRNHCNIVAGVNVQCYGKGFWEKEGFQSIEKFDVQRIHTIDLFVKAIK